LFDNVIYLDNSATTRVDERVLEAIAAVALGLGSCQVAALYDEEANTLLGVDGQEESVIYMTVVGRKTR